MVPPFSVNTTPTMATTEAEAPVAIVGGCVTVTLVNHWKKA